MKEYQKKIDQNFLKEFLDKKGLNESSLNELVNIEIKDSLKKARLELMNKFYLQCNICYSCVGYNQVLLEQEYGKEFVSELLETLKRNSNNYLTAFKEIEKEEV
jgi:DNA polymerase III alpha subunit